MKSYTAYINHYDDTICWSQPGQALDIYSVFYPANILAMTP